MAADKTFTSRRDQLQLILFAAALLAVHTVVNRNYGFHRDELATLDDARHLAWGYVAYPPLTPFLGRVELELFGTSVAGFRFFAAAAQSIALLLTAAMARHQGGGRASQWIAAAAVAVAPISIGASSLFQYVAFDYLWWVAIAYFMVRLIEDDDQRWWIAIGITIGLGVLTKYSIAFCVAGVVAGVVFTPLRRHLRSRWLWLGVALSILVALPNLVWQARHDFITLEFLKSIHARDVRIGRTAGFLSDQLDTNANPITLPLWMAGLVALCAGRRDRRYRALAWMAIVPFVLFFFAKGRGYYLGPVYPALFAAGAVSLETLLRRMSRPRRVFAFAAIAVLFVIGSGVALLIMPIAPIGSPLWQRASALNGDLKEEVGWPEMTAEVARIWNTIPAAERTSTAIFCANYGEAGAINLYGPAFGLPPAISGVNSFWARGYGAVPPATVIILGSHYDRLIHRFGSVTLAGHIPNPHHVANEEADHPDIFICRNPKEPWPVLWPKIRSFG